MQNIRQKIKTKYQSHRNKIHWGVFIIFSFFISTLLLNPLEINLKKDNNNFISTVNAQVLNTWEPPIGIPAPGFGILDKRPDRPNPWNMQQPGYYYVNYEIGSDTNNPFGTPQNPRKTIPNPLPAGSYVEVHGVYNYAQSGLIWINGLGTDGPWAANKSGPVWVVGENINNRPRFTYRVIIYGTYIYLDTISTGSGGRLQIGSGATGYGADYIVIRNCDVAGDEISPGSGVGIGGSQDTAVSHVVLYQNTIHHYGDINSALDQDYEGIAIGGYASNIWLLENTIHTTSGSGVQVVGNNNSSLTHHIYGGRNIIFNTRQAGFAVKYASDVIFSQNHVYDIVDTPWSPSKGFGAQYAPKRIWILYNTFHGMRYGIFAPSTTSTDGPYEYYAIGNVIYNIHHTSGLYTGGSWGEAGIMMYGGTSQYIINNTIYDSDAGINGAGGGEYYIQNNIISEITEQNGNHIYIEDAKNKFTEINNSILHQNGGNERIRWGNALYNLNSFQSNTGKGQNSLATDPLFVNPAIGNFQISPASPAKDAGLSDNALSLNVYAKFKEFYGLDINVDINITQRPQGPAWDIGAYEYKDSAADNEAPSIPANLTANSISSFQINLSWTQSTDNTAVTNYKVYRNFQLVKSLNAATYSDTGLSANTTYTYSVSAIDGSGNESAKSTEASVATLSSSSSDLNQDGKVDSTDFGILKLDWNKTTKPKSDINQDGIVDTRDLGIMMGEWGG